MNPPSVPVVMSPVGQFDGGATLDSSSSISMNMSGEVLLTPPVVDLPPELGAPRLFTVGSEEPAVEIPVPAVRYEASPFLVEVDEQLAGKKAGRKRGRKKGKKGSSSGGEEQAPRTERREGLRDTRRHNYKE